VAASISLFEASPIAMSIMDPQGRFLQQNAAAERVLGYTAAELHRRHFATLAPPEDAEEEVRLFERLLSGELDRYQLTRRYRHREGGEVWGRLTAEAVRAPTGRLRLVLRMLEDVTARKQAEDALRGTETEYLGAEERLRARERHFRALIENAMDLTLVVRPDGTITYASPASYRLFGYPVEEVTGRSVFDFVVPEDWAETRRRLLGLVAGDPGVHRLEVRVRRADGTCRVLETAGRSMVDDPVVDGIVLNARDITEAKHAEEWIRFQAGLLDAVAEAVVACDADWRIVYWNRAAESQFGWKADEAIGRRVRGVIPTRDTPWSSRKAFVQAALAGEHGRAEMTLVRRDGSAFPALATVSPLRDEANRSIGYIGVITDLSELRAAERLIAENERRLRALFENTSENILLLDASRRITFVSPSRRRVPVAESIIQVGADILNPKRIHREDYPKVVASLTHVYAAPGNNANLEARVLGRDGTWRVLEAEAVNLLHLPTIGAVVVTARDVTERRHLEQQLSQSQRMEAIGRRAGGVAHDINNHLTAITGLTALMLRSLPPESPLYSDLKEIRKAAERAANLTRQLLAFSRRQVLRPQVLSLNAIIHDLRKLLARLIGEDIAIVADLAEDLNSVHADPGQIEQVLMNLVVNARDAMREGGTLLIRTANVDLPDAAPPGTVSLPAGRYVLLEVRDTGTGIAPDILPRIFEPFFTTKPKGEGTGLGLSTAFGIISQSGGEIRVESEPGVGTAFFVYLPGLDDQPEPIEPKVIEEIPRGAGRVLLVEDDLDVRTVARRVLDLAGYTVIEAESGVEALEIALRERGSIDVLLTDVVMPRMGGPELVVRLRSLGVSPAVVFMSGYTDDALALSGMLAEGTPLVHKPFTPETLAGAVRQALRARGPAEAPHPAG